MFFQELKGKKEIECERMNGKVGKNTQREKVKEQKETKKKNGEKGKSKPKQTKKR